MRSKGMAPPARPSGPRPVSRRSTLNWMSGMGEVSSGTEFGDGGAVDAVEAFDLEGISTPYSSAAILCASEKASRR